MNPPDQYKALLITRNNVISVISLSVKFLLDKSCLQDPLDGYRSHVMNFLTVLEHVIYFRAKGPGFIFSEKMSQHPWKLFSAHCTSIPHNSISTIKQLDNLTNDFARIRAVFRMALIEKRLHEYISAAFSDSSMNSKFYSSHSIILSSHLPSIINHLSGLSAIDFSFDLKANLNHPGFYPIDYSLYMADLKSSSVDIGYVDGKCCHENGDGYSSREKYELLLSKCKVDLEQKKYLEEIVVDRDSKILALEKRNEIFHSEMQALENSVTDFQIQLTLLHEQYSNEIEKLGGNPSLLNIPSVKSAAGSRADFLSSRHPLTNQFSHIDNTITNDVDNQCTSPLPHLAPFSFTDSVQDCYTKLSKMAAPNGGLRSKSSSFSQFQDSPDNSQGKFIIGKQLILNTTQRFYSPNNNSNRKFPGNNNNDCRATPTNHDNTNVDYPSRLFDMKLEEQRARIMESQQLRKIMGQACRSPKIKARQRSQTQYLNIPKSQSFERADSYFVDEMSNSFNYSNSFDDNFSPNDRLVTLYSPDDEASYYHLSSTPALEMLSDDDFFEIPNSRADELGPRMDQSVTNIDRNIQLFPPLNSQRLSPIVTAEVPENMEPLSRQRANYGSSDNFVNGDRGSGRSRNSTED